MARKDASKNRKDRDVYSETVSKSPDRSLWGNGAHSTSFINKNNTPYTQNNLTTNGSDYAGNSNKKRQNNNSSNGQGGDKQQNVLRDNNGKQQVKHNQSMNTTLNQFGTNHKRAKSQSK